MSLPGFASTDPEFRGIAAWEAVIAARTGQFTDMGLNRRLMGINPSFTPLGLTSAYGASFGAMSVLFALTARAQMGGEHIEVPLASALLEGLVYNCEQIEDYPERYKSPREVELERRAREGLPNDLTYAQLSEFLAHSIGPIPAQMGAAFMSSPVPSPPTRPAYSKRSGLAELPDFDAYLDQADWPDDWSLRDYPVGDRDRARVSEAMKAAFLTKPSHEWEALFGAAKAPATAQRSSVEWLSDPHALAFGLVVEVNDPRHGMMRQMGNVAWLTGDEAATDKVAGPEPDDFRAALSQLLAEPARPSVGADDKGGWLDGLKVLDLTNVIAGPTIGSTLARFGADVTLMRSVTPSVDPWNAVVFGLRAHRGKGSIVLNLRSDDGQGVFWRLVAEADVVTMIRFGPTRRPSSPPPLGRLRR